ncbi:MAG: hypothetical protein AAF438_18485, partial [Pseudomonadota bacterium]
KSGGLFEWMKLGVAATLVASLSIVLMQTVYQNDSGREADDPGGYIAPKDTGQVDQLMARSAELEQALRRISYGDRNVVDVRTVETIVALEDRLALVDYGLSQRRLTPRQRQDLWQERVRLMDSLLRVHYARMQRNSY